MKDLLRGVRIYRDVEYDHLVVELDVWRFHATTAQRDADLERDLETLVEGRHIVRLGWAQVFSRACHTAGMVVRLMLDARGRGVRMLAGLPGALARSDACVASGCNR